MNFSKNKVRKYFLDQNFCKKYGFSYIYHRIWWLSVLQQAFKIFCRYNNILIRIEFDHS